MAKKVKNPGGPTGRPRRTFTAEQLDDAKERLGRRYYPSKVATELQEKWSIDRDASYALIAAAQVQVYEALAGQPGAENPLSAMYLFLSSVIADEKVAMRDKVNAANAVIRMLGLNKIADLLGEGDVDDFLAGVVARRKKRAAAERKAKAKPRGPG